MNIHDQLEIIEASRAKISLVCSNLLNKVKIPPESDIKCLIQLIKDLEGVCSETIQELKPMLNEKASKYNVTK